MHLEEMAAFFDARVDGYEEHMYENIVGARGFYKETAKCMPRAPLARVLDLGCGTGLELDEIFKIMPDARVTGIDLSAGMLNRLREKHKDKALYLIQGSYFDVDFGRDLYDGAVSVESLHHFEREKKTGLYRKICAALKAGGAYVETDYTAPDDACERFHFAEMRRMRAEQQIPEDAFYHYDTPHTVEHLIEMMKEAGFARVEFVWKVENTAILRAWKD